MKLFALFLVLSLAATAQGQPHVRVYAVALANDSAGAFLGASSKGSGLYQSDDTGKTWKHLGWENGKLYSMDLLKSENGRVIYVSGGLGVLKSTDYGSSWRQMTDWRVAEAMDVTINQRNPAEVWIASATGPWQSQDSGKTWHKHTEGMEQKYCSRIMFDTTNFQTLALATEDGFYTRTVAAKKWKHIRKIDRPIRAMVFYSGGWNVEGDGISARVKHDSVTAMKYRDVVHWTLSIDPSLMNHFFLFGGPAGAEWHRGSTNESIDVKDVASSALVAPEILLGTLGKGVYRRSTNDYALDGRQIWTLRTVLVK